MNENIREDFGISHHIVRQALNSAPFDETIYQRALAAGESDKSARAKATTQYGPVASPEIKSAPSEIKSAPSEVKCEHAGGHYLTKSEYIWGEFFLLLRWVVAAAVIITIVIVVTAPQVAPSCF